jgi:hypothetical protein
MKTVQHTLLNLTVQGRTVVVLLVVLISVVDVADEL